MIKKNYGLFYALPTALWFTIFFAAPLVIIVIYSFLTRDTHGGVVFKFTLDAYKSLANPGFGLIALRTLLTSIAATVLIILIALPCGYYMARSKNQTFLLMLVIIPFWTNFLIRVYAWIAILGNNGFLNNLLLKTKLISDYVQFLYNQEAVILVLVYMYLPYAILPLYSTIDKFDFALLEAARDLGATKPQSMFKVLLPNIQSGIFTAVLFTFIPIFGAYAVPLLIGGKDSYMMGNVIADQLTKARNWPLSSAISMVITMVTTLGVLLLLRIQRRDKAASQEALLASNRTEDSNGK
ncbi:MAG TPA: ABC transporter permease [Spirochaetia bacterium]|nr:ABC transporter permease [Spirochaetales bacterium]HPD80009.1 ABC transporter permease [Spirochaetales bacterium]HQK33568.1 ABC transporter permease [Spirochaetales bacterium]HRS64519.1 ABC transporter permease [Spirochaetia bacterium]HRV29493.1 ABC transporter permease [Spirochaetia bacterium]